MNTVILTKVKVKSINDVNIPARESNKIRVDAFMLGDVYFCDDTQNEILENIFSREELNYNELILEGEV